MSVFILLCAFFILLILGAPVAIALFLSSIAYFIYSGQDPFMASQAMVMSIGNSFTLLAIPLFTLAGIIMNTGGITEKIFHFANCMVKHITGGMGHTNVAASVIFSGMSGTAVADTSGLGAIELKAMRDAGYKENFSLAVTGASSIIGPIIPPSVPAVLYAVIAGVSVGQIFVAGIVPGILLSVSLSLFIWYRCKKEGLVPDPKASRKQRWEAFKGAFWALLTPVIIIGGIISGVFTPTESAVIAVFYALGLSLFSGEITLRKLPSLVTEASKIVVGVLFIVASSAMFAWILTIEQVPTMIADAFSSNIPNVFVALIAINIILLICGSFLETIAALTILTPILLPLASSYGIDPVHFGIIMILNLMIGLLTPPMGMVLYVLSSVGKVEVDQIVKAILPYIILFIFIVLFLSFFPAVVMTLPGLVFN
ncbi:TRAP transporter large permease [Photobacterium satsumensis]|uniref:TRAP transporter large permease n=1 Tax=Photobacterium satsumensis TaxID=2910239 RepID=UPI003D100ED9